ncbi:MAG: choice-of-anchor Q domain-containing protein [Rikenellaceae bacterium]
MANCVLWNSSDSPYPVDKTIDCDSNNVYITNCAFIDGFDSGTNIVTLTDETGVKSPMFNDDYTLQSGSPLINAGDNSFLSSSYTTDLKGDTRIQNGRVDIGAYEYNY